MGNVVVECLPRDLFKTVFPDMIHCTSSVGWQSLLFYLSMQLKPVKMSQIQLYISGALYMHIIDTFSLAFDTNADLLCLFSVWEF